MRLGSLWIFLVLGAVAVQPAKAGPELSAYEIEEALLQPFLKRVSEEPEKLGALLDRMDEMAEEGKLRNLGCLTFEDVKPDDISYLSAAVVEGCNTHELSATWYHQHGKRVLNGVNIDKKSTGLMELELSLGHALGKRWELSAVIALEDSYLVIVERNPSAAQDSGSKGWVVSPSPMSRVKLDSDRSPMVVRQFQEWSEGSFVVRRPELDGEKAEFSMKLLSRPKVLSGSLAKFELSAMFRFYPQKNSLATLNWRAQVFEKKRPKGYSYLECSGNSGTKLEGAMSVAKGEGKVTRRSYEKSQNGSTNNAESTDDVMAIQMVVLEDALR